MLRDRVVSSGGAAGTGHSSEGGRIYDILRKICRRPTQGDTRLHVVCNVSVCLVERSMLAERFHDLYDLTTYVGCT